MGCTSSNQVAIDKQNPTSAPAPIIDDGGQQLVNDSFRIWLKTNRPKADEYVLNDVLSTAPPANEVEDYKTIVGKALDLLSDHKDIKSTNKLGKMVQKEITLASPRKVQHTINILKQTADKLRSGNIQLETEQQETNQEPDTDQTVTLENKNAIVQSGEPGIALKDALEKARVLFYKGKQAAIFANPNGGYDVRVLDEHDETINHDSNLLRSIVLTEVKLRPKTRTTPLFNAPPPPTSLPPLKVLDENEITDDFRRSIDAALKGLEAVYQTKPSPTITTTTTGAPVESIQEIHVEKITSIRPTSPPLVLQYGVTNAPLPKSISKEQTNLSNEQPPAAPIDNTVHLAEIIRQMAEQQKFASEQLSKPVDDTSELTMDAIDATTTTVEENLISSNQIETTEQIVTAVSREESQGQIERIVREIREHGEKYESKESLPSMTPPAKQASSYSLGLTSPLQNESTVTLSSSSSPPPSSSVRTKGKLRSENRPKSFISTEESSKKDTFQLIKQMSLDEIAHLTQTGLSNPNLTTSVTKLGISTSSGKIEEEHLPTTTSDQALTKMATSISQIIEEHQPILEEEPAISTTTGAAPVVTPVESSIKIIKSPSHNVTYTEIIHSESRDGEQSRHFITESYDEHPSNEDEQTTTLKVITKSEFSNHPTSGEKIMEQSVQVITVKVRNETIKTMIQQATLPTTTTTETDIAYERRPVSELVKNFEVASSNTNT